MMLFWSIKGLLNLNFASFEIFLEIMDSEYSIKSLVDNEKVKDLYESIMNKTECLYCFY